MAQEVPSIKGSIEIDIQKLNSQLDKAIGLVNEFTNRFKKSLDEIEKDIRSTFQSFSQGVKIVNRDIITLSKSTDQLTKEQKELKKEINSLLTSGVDPFSEKVKKLNSQYDRLQKETR